MAAPLTREEALGVLRTGHEQVVSLVSGLPETAALRAGIGGGDWCVKDLLGHLTSWEERALGAIEAWREGKDASTAPSSSSTRISTS